MAIILITRRSSGSAAIDDVSCSCSLHAAASRNSSKNSCNSSSASSQLLATLILAVLVSLYGVGAWSSRPLLLVQPNNHNNYLYNYQGSVATTDDRRHANLQHAKHNKAAHRPAADMRTLRHVTDSRVDDGSTNTTNPRHIVAIETQGSHVQGQVDAGSGGGGGGGGTVRAFMMFGDSTADVGNNNHLVTVSRSDFRPYGRDLAGPMSGHPTGRFSNGLLATDYMACMVGLKHQTVAYLETRPPQSRSKGARKCLERVNGMKQLQMEPLSHQHLVMSFASSSSGFYESTARHFNALSLSMQLELFKEYKARLMAGLGKDNASEIMDRALYIITTGTNDYINNYYFNPYLRARYSIAQFHALLIQICAKFIEDLYDLGARRIGIVSFPPLGCLPAEITLHRQNDCVRHLNDIAVSFNQHLQTTIVSLRRRLHGSKIAYLDSYNVLKDAITNPTPYGFKQARRACCGSGKLEVALFCNRLTPGTCKDASKYVFWDSFHPTDHMNQVMAAKLFEKSWQDLGIDEPDYGCCPTNTELKQPSMIVTSKWRWNIFLLGWLLFLLSMSKRFFPKMISLGV